MRESDKNKAKIAADQLENLIKENSTGDWEFYLLNSVNVEVSPGCLSALTGKKSSYVPLDQVIFRKKA